MLINPAIEIKTLNGKVYEFASFFIPYCDTCYKLCCELFNRYKRTIAAAQVASPTQCKSFFFVRALIIGIYTGK